MIKSRRMRWPEHVARIGRRGTHIGRKATGEEPLRRQRRRWMDNIRMDHGDVEWDDMDWIALARDRDKWKALMNVVMKFRVP
jgi:hypothetical protein